MQLRPTKLAAEAAKASADHIAIVQRAYVFMASASSPDLGHGFPVDDDNIVIHTVKYAFDNHGRTPAVLRDLSIDVSYIGADIVPSMLPRGGILPSPFMIKSCGVWGEHTLEFKISGRDLNFARIGEGRIMLRGLLGYADIFGTRHEVGFCHYWHFKQSRFVISEYRELNFST